MGLAAAVCFEIFLQNLIEAPLDSSPLLHLLAIQRLTSHLHRLWTPRCSLLAKTLVTAPIGSPARCTTTAPNPSLRPVVALQMDGLPMERQQALARSLFVLADPFFGPNRVEFKPEGREGFWN